MCRFDPLSAITVRFPNAEGILTPPTVTGGE